ncbi:MAG TPA: flavodoxin-dependent (E)-4-hydroxy-3-methylbut-2-enyl-diphosphate synthase, partial [Candidatus Polarisedimenticolia bacterium]|nr:flavodoxin-dependent (E)-4-hydroxy-3-methylbut-2-enyl-diphosphate synthase [Candidatus Polarisedimenticolia bacterium]
SAAMMAVEHVEKVRINPGNYADTKRFKVWEYTDAEYQAELERLEQRFRPLVLRAKERGVALRIGTNHGSLSDRILNRYGDTPLGMVESALEFVRICERHGHRNLILSMKSSNPMVMIQAYRLLADRMAAERMDYPFHLGVTEAGDGEDGRLKSAIGIGSLLEDGIGDTIRVSLTEDPVAEIPVAQALVRKYNAWGREQPASPAQGSPEASPPILSSYSRRGSARIELGGLALGGQEPVRVECLLRAPLGDAASLKAELDLLSSMPATPDVRVEILEVDLSRAEEIPLLENLGKEMRAARSRPAFSARASSQLLAELAEPELRGLARSCDRLTIRLDSLQPKAGETLERILHRLGAEGPSPAIEFFIGSDPENACSRAAELARLCDSGTGRFPLLSLTVEPGLSPVGPYRHLARSLAERSFPAPLLLVAETARREEDPLLFASVYLGSLLCDGLGDAVRVEHFGSPADSLRLAFNILQGTRLRLFKTEFISCPSCGRTQFDLEETTRRIKARTAHLKGVKIAIMGCIVNGPGEMADADFGYVGWGPGKVSLFVGKELVEKDIPYAEADERLVRLIREHGRWDEPASLPTPAPVPAGKTRE